MTIEQRDVATHEVLEGFDALADIYSHVPPLIMWRAWEHAVYRRYRLAGPVLDIGCGDGRFFDRVFPNVMDVTGVDHSLVVVDLARRSGRYVDVHHTSADALPLPDGSFNSVFANCSLEHMDNIDGVLGEIHRVLRPGGTFLFSVVTDHFVTRAPLQWVLDASGAGDVGRAVQRRHEAYHHLVNAFPVDEWFSRCERAGFRLHEWTPIVAGPAGWVFLMLDQLWHVERTGGEVGEEIMAWFESNPKRAAGLRRIFEGLLDLAADAPDYAGIVLLAER
jgi:SAM-dependent methyltransferase